MMVSREVWGLRDGTPTNKKKHQQTRKTPTNKKNTNKQEKTPTNKGNTFRARETPFEQGKRLSSKGYLPIKCKSLQVVGVSGQGKAVVSDGG